MMVTKLYENNKLPMAQCEFLNLHVDNYILISCMYDLVR